MRIRLSAFTRTCLLLSIIPAGLGGCVVAATRGWHDTLADAAPVGKGDALLGFTTVLLGPLSWLPPSSSLAPLGATLVTIALLSMMLAHSVFDNRLGRALTCCGFVLWWLCGLIFLVASYL